MNSTSEIAAADSGEAAKHREYLFRRLFHQRQVTSPFDVEAHERLRIRILKRQRGCSTDRRSMCSTFTELG